MRTIHQRVPWRRLAWLTLGASFFMSGCDPQLRTTVESGIINVSTGLLSAFLQAVIQLAGEGGEETVRVLSELAPALA